jgi:hypothetical protein
MTQPSERSDSVVMMKTTMDLSGEEMVCGAVVRARTATSMVAHREAMLREMRTARFLGSVGAARR